jgi:kynureninase
MGPLREKSEKQIAYLDHLLDEVLVGRVESITPRSLTERGCQFSLRVIADGHNGLDVFNALESAGVACDWRHPDVIRIAPVPLYNSFADIHRFVQVLDGILS